MNKEVKGMLLDALVGVLSEIYVSWESRDKKYVVSEEREYLDRANLIDIAREHIVPGSNAIAVMQCNYQGKGKKILDLFCKTDLPDVIGTAFDLVTEKMICICYLSNDEIIEKQKNCFINIRTKRLSNDVKELFKDGDLVILQ
jgi:hypothetical protein